jgi:hypothetical protein
MSERLVITSEDPILDTLPFKSFLNPEERCVAQFLPGPDEPQEIMVMTPWGAELKAEKGDYLVSDIAKPKEAWPVSKEIFERTYIITRPGFCMKSAVTELVPMVELTAGDPDQMVVVQTLEGPETVRAGDFYLARGIDGEIWPYPFNRKTGTVMIPKEEIQKLLKEKKKQTG